LKGKYIAEVGITGPTCIWHEIKTTVIRKTLNQVLFLWPFCIVNGMEKHEIEKAHKSFTLLSLQHLIYDAITTEDRSKYFPF
jgi:hypothetical protein